MANNDLVGSVVKAMALVKIIASSPDGLKNSELAEAADEVKENERADFEELRIVAEASYCHLRSTFLQIRFVRARNHGFDKQVMAECAKEELKLTMDLYQIVRRDSRIGFEASNHYYYSLNDLREKVISCNRILEELA